MLCYIIAENYILVLYQQYILLLKIIHNSTEIEEGQTGYKCRDREKNREREGERELPERGGSRTLGVFIGEAHCLCYCLLEKTTGLCYCLNMREASERSLGGR